MTMFCRSHDLILVNFQYKNLFVSVGDNLMIPIYTVFWNRVENQFESWTQLVFTHIWIDFRDIQVAATQAKDHHQALMGNQEVTDNQEDFQVKHHLEVLGNQPVTGIQVGMAHHHHQPPALKPSEHSMPWTPIVPAKFLPRNYKRPYRMARDRDSLINVVN